ncbi:MAG TPA: type II secretion system protein [Patescibacteria group bacterium]|jgi:prepilin-type N-terminal cleavage/methylation domain-containing protein|nr:type II secretion system protein [Patescibacteria group bacterium]
MLQKEVIKQKLNKGFTIVELLIVIVVIGILAALVLNSFSGVQAKARDTKRQTDMKALATQLEVCYNDKCGSSYPTLVQLTDTSAGGFIQTNMKGLDVNALKDSNGATIQANAPAATNQYQYSPTPAGCTGTTGATLCTSFTLQAFQEKTPTTPYVKTSLN